MALSKQTEKSSFSIAQNEGQNRIGTLMGITVINAVEPLLTIKMKYSVHKNASEKIIDYIVKNTLNVFLAFVERKQSVELEPQLFALYIALSVLDINVSHKTN